MPTPDSETDRREPATPFKLMEARRKGMVARGADLGFLVVLAVLYAYFALAGPWLLQRIADVFRAAMIVAPQLADGPAVAGLVAVRAIERLAAPMVLLLVLLFTLVGLVEFFQTGPVLSAQPLRPDFSRLSPAQAFKRVFSARTLIEAAKTVLKLAVYVAVAALTTVGAVHGFANAGATDRFMRLFWAQTLAFLLLAVGAAAAIAIADQLIARGAFRKQMRMSVRELRREVRDREGEPRQKQRRRQLHAEYVRNTRSLRGMKGADVLIVNPTHVAIALKYEPRNMPAPKIVAVGQGGFAVRLRRLAALYRTEIVENPALARLLYPAGLDAFIPETAYEAVADIYRAREASPDAPSEDRAEGSAET